MNNSFLNMRKINLGPFIIISAFLILICLGHSPVSAQGQEGKGPQIGVGGFIDEDGDGFNDLLPDSDGDGVPDALDPDSRGHYNDTLGNGRQMHVRADSARMEHHRMGDDSLQMRMHEGPGMPGPGGFGDPGQFHGEPGQFGPGDSSMHGGMCPDDSMGGHHGGMGPDGGGGGMGPNGGGMGPGPSNIGGGSSPLNGSSPIERGDNAEGLQPKANAGQSQEMKREGNGN
jgi:hypothetical protein